MNELDAAASPVTMMNVEAFEASRATDLLIERVMLALTLVPESLTRDLLKEALFATASAKDTPQLRLRLALLSSLIVDCFRATPTVALGLLDDVEHALNSLESSEVTALRGRCIRRLGLFRPRPARPSPGQ